LRCRGRQEAAKLIDRGLTARMAPRRHDAAAAEGGRHRVCALFDPSVADEIAARWPDHRADVIARADRIRERRFSLLGYKDLWFGNPVDWALDPVSGRRAPQEHWSRIKPLDPGQVGDCKVTWELSRHQWLVTLAQAYRLSGDEVYAEAGAELLTSWLDANPRGQGLNR